MKTRLARRDDAADVARGRRDELAAARVERDALAEETARLRDALAEVSGRAEAAEAELLDATETAAEAAAAAENAAALEAEATDRREEAEARAERAVALEAETRRLEAELEAANARADAADAELDAWSRECDEFAGQSNDAQRVRYHHKVRQQRDALKKEVERGAARTRRVEQALRMLCDGTEACRERLLRDAREPEGIDAKARTQSGRPTGRARAHEAPKTVLAGVGDDAEGVSLDETIDQVYGVPIASTEYR